MKKPLVFMMGRSPAILPTDRRYARNHMWAAPVDGGYRFGLSAYAVRLLGDVRRFQPTVEEGLTVARGQQIAFVEASKATSDLYAPIAGRIAQCNQRLPGEPGLINTNLYDDGWLLTIIGSGDELLSADQYVTHLEASWPLAQRLLKGQAHGHDDKVAEERE